ncbi:glycosyltransferase family 87 protein [Bradyrhizobium roseum]|uniref:glycosyltransferase family 87 protein n=1 Tax=Bradyrhizobium roseum TaxID=3056648 RepID=UPI002620B929|nr:glycosyltransferase family 87 protein [Bradyrhizobium roseus]WKA31552.1 glycosyltransferase family 87 protein [Bradyrhizobium roseus]
MAGETGMFLVCWALRTWLPGWLQLLLRPRGATLRERFGSVCRWSISANKSFTFWLYQKYMTTSGQTTAFAATEKAYGASTAVAAIFLVFFATLAFKQAADHTSSAFIVDPWGFPLGRDFLNSWMAGRAMFSGGPAAWFDADVYMAVLRKVTGLDGLEPMYWSYPPHLVLLVWPFGQLGYLPSYVFWCVAGLALYVWAAVAGGVDRRYWLFLAISPAIIVNVLLGQNGFLTAALLIGGLINLDRRPVFAGILLGVLTVKPQLGLLLPVLLLLGGHWRVIASAVATTVLLVVATAVWFGPDIWMEYWQKVGPQQHELINTAGIKGWPIVASAFVNARLVGLSDHVAWMIQGTASAGAFGAVVWTFWRKRDPVLSHALFVVAIFVFSPWIMNYDMVVFGWIVALLRQRDDQTLLDHCLALALWMLPLAMIPLGVGHIPGALMILPLFAVRLLWRLAHEASERAPPAEPAAIRGRGIPPPEQAGRAS